MREILSGVLLLACLEFFVALTDELFEHLGADTILIEFIFLFLYCLLCKNGFAEYSTIQTLGKF